MARSTPGNKLVEYAKNHPSMHNSSFIEHAIVYRGPYLDTSTPVMGDIINIKGEITTGTQQYVVIMERSRYNKVMDKLNSLSGSINDQIEFLKSDVKSGFLTQTEIDAIETSDETTDRAIGLYIANWASAYTRKMPKGYFGDVHIDFTNPINSPIIKLEISNARTGAPRDVSHITILDISWKNPGDIRHTSIVPIGVSEQIKSADVSNSNSLGKNLQNGMQAILNDGCDKGVIQVVKRPAMNNRSS
jgi:hypothetical protein